MSGPRNNDELFLRGLEFIERLLVQGDHRLINSSYNQQGRGLGRMKSFVGEIRPASARDDGSNRARKLGGGHQCRSGARTCAEIAYFQVRQLGISLDPPSRAHQALCKQTDIEAQLRSPLVDCFFFQGEQIEKQSGNSARSQNFSHVLIAGTQAAASAAVSEKNNPDGRRGKPQDSFQLHFSQINRNFMLDPTSDSRSTLSH